mmetsp:Transcript_42684/g.65488  ORF Transcript_42684/g.65488 Transcript_42684/m.65488 type:complete len:151 (+) Transcript_42684:1347-1799(+)
MLKMFKSIIVMVCLAYFTGLAWYVFSSYNSTRFSNSFIEAYEFEEMFDTSLKRISALTYYVFTTLSTVGLGDFTPKNSAERVLMTFIMLFGVMFTSFLMDSFSTMLAELRSFNDNFDDSERFNLFLGTMKKLNGDKPLPKKLIQEMEAYF